MSTHFSVIFHVVLHHIVLAKLATSSIRVNSAISQGPVLPRRMYYQAPTSSTCQLAPASEFLKKGIAGKYILVFTDFLSNVHIFI